MAKTNKIYHKIWKEYKWNRFKLSILEWIPSSYR